MVIILKRIPEYAKKSDIADFLQAELKGKIFQKSGHIEQIKILVHRRAKPDTLELYGLVYIDLDVAAKRVIKKLDRKKFLGKHIAVKEYVYRSWQNDPRESGIKQKVQTTKRKAERRQAKLREGKKAAISYSGDEGFHRKL